MAVQMVLDEDEVPGWVGRSCVVPLGTANDLPIQLGTYQVCSVSVSVCAVCCVLCDLFLCVCVCVCTVL